VKRAQLQNNNPALIPNFANFSKFNSSNKKTGFALASRMRRIGASRLGRSGLPSQISKIRVGFIAPRLR